MSLNHINQFSIKEKIQYYSNLFSEGFGQGCIVETSYASAVQKYRENIFYHLRSDICLSMSVDISENDIESMVQGLMPCTMTFENFYNVYSYIEASRQFIDSISNFKLTPDYLFSIHKVLCKYNNIIPRGYRNRSSCKSDKIPCPPHYVIKYALDLVFYKMGYSIKEPLEFFFGNIALLLWVHPFNYDNIRTSILFTRIFLLSRGYNIYIPEGIINNISHFRKCLLDKNFESLCLSFRSQLAR